jgi:hypothetical protein
MIDYENTFSLENVSPHSVAGLVKLWVRELPEPLLTFALYDSMVKVRIKFDLKLAIP